MTLETFAVAFWGLFVFWCMLIMLSSKSAYRYLPRIHTHNLKLTPEHSKMIKIEGCICRYRPQNTLLVNKWWIISFVWVSSLKVKENPSYPVFKLITLWHLHHCWLIVTGMVMIFSLNSWQEVDLIVPFMFFFKLKKYFDAVFQRLFNPKKQTKCFLLIWLLYLQHEATQTMPH